MNTILMIETLIDGDQIVYRLDGETLEIAANAPNAAELIAAFCPPAPEPVPHDVPRRQAKIALSRAGLLADADAAIAAMPGQPGEEARINWADAPVFERDHPLIMSLGARLGLTSDQIDDLFRVSSRIA